MKERHDKTAYGIVVLAAGTSERLGRPKQLLKYKGDSLLKRAVTAAQQVKAGALIVVLGVETGSLMAEMKDPKAAIAINRQFREGIASSIRCGVRYMMDHHDKIDHLILMVCDQPYVDAAHLQALIGKHKTSGATIVASSYAGRKGVPALFDKTVFPELLLLSGDTGAKRIIEKYDTRTATVPFPRGAIDIDTEEAYRALVNGSI